MKDETVQPYVRIMQEVEGAIRSGRLSPQDKLPSTRDLAAQHEVALGTVQRALRELRNAGLIYSHQGGGSYVSDAALEKVQADPTARAIRDLQEQVADLTIRLEALERGQQH
ncbi:GntR family transcriptional regulator [Streptomyces sp. NPDC090442]|uniref:GntR family transcriptional regulator n=1 Tax=Streptomyces sp. NPDC090442 TaxID=3365962 RepID=UPI003823417E